MTQYGIHVIKKLSSKLEGIHCTYMRASVTKLCQTPTLTPMGNFGATNKCNPQLTCFGTEGGNQSKPTQTQGECSKS